MFDFDGVIADSLDLTNEAMRNAFEAHGFGHLASDELMLTLVESNWFDGLQKAGLPSATVAAIDDHVAAIASAGHLKPYPAIADVIARLARGSCILVVTSNRTDIVETCLTQWGISEVTEVLGGDKGKSKVDKIRSAVSRYAPSEAWFIGDTVGDIVEGRKAGVFTVAAAWGWHPGTQLRTVKPDQIADTPTDLLRLLS
jgi:phosphoglycolate phosphatase